MCRHAKTTSPVNARRLPPPVSTVSRVMQPRASTAPTPKRADRRQQSAEPGSPRRETGEHRTRSSPPPRPPACRSAPRPAPAPRHHGPRRARPRAHQRAAQAEAGEERQRPEGEPEERGRTRPRPRAGRSQTEGQDRVSNMGRGLRARDVGQLGPLFDAAQRAPKNVCSAKSGQWRNQPHPTGAKTGQSMVHSSHPARPDLFRRLPSAARKCDPNRTTGPPPRRPTRKTPSPAAAPRATPFVNKSKKTNEADP
jgi:hypothetical protein